MAKTTGFEMNELLGVIATVSEVTQNSASTIGNSVKTLLSRMSNVKAGVEIDPESGEALNDVEKVLNRVGIALKDNQGNWYDFYDVLDEIASRWDNFSQIQQSQITTALGGTRQRENVLVMLENWDKVKQYAETGASSAGTAMEKYGIVLESVESKQAQLTAKTQEFYSNVLSDSVLTGLLDIGNGLMDIVNIGDGAVGKILLLTTATLALSAVLSHLTDNGKKTFAELIAGFIGVSVAEGTATTGAGLLKVALDLLKSHPVILGLSILTTALIAGKAIFDHFNVTLEEQHDKAQQAKADYQEVASELQSVNDELKTTEERIKELTTKGKLSFTEEEELETLKKTNAELEKRQYWLDLEAKQKRQEVGEEASKAWDKDFNDKGEFYSQYKWRTNGSKIGITESEHIQEQIQYYGELEQKLQNLVAKKDQWTEEEKQQYKSLVDEQNKTKDYLESTGAKIQTDFIDAYDVDNATKQKWVDLQDTIQNTLNPPTRKDALSELLDNQTQDWTNYYTQLAKMGELTESSFTDGFKDQIKNAFNLEDTDIEGFSKAIQEIIDYFSDLAETSVPTSESLNEVAKGLSALTEKYDLLKEAQEEYTEAGSISSKTLDNIIEKYPAMAENVALYVAGLKSESELLADLQNAYNADETNYENLMRAKLLVSSEFYNNLSSNQKDSIKNLFEAYEADFGNFKTVEEAKLSFNAQVIQKLSQNWSKYAGKSVEFLRKQRDSLELLSEKQYAHGMKNTNAQSEFSALTQALNDMSSFANSLDNIVLEGVDFNAKTFSPKEIKAKTKKSKSGSSKEWWETELDKLKTKLENNEITMNSYINSLEKLRGKLKKGSEGFAEVNKVLQEAKLDNLNNQFERGEITIDKYIKGLEKLRKGYKKGTEGYKELTKQINESKADMFADQFERGEISAKKYIKQLTKIRDAYKKNSEEWKKYNDLIRDEVKDGVTEYYENQKERAEKQAELTKKQTLYNKEVELYGKDGKDLWEYNNDKKIEALEKQLEARNAEKEALDDINEREELENDLLEARLKLQNALNNKTTKILTKQANGTWAYTFSANMADVKSAQDEVDSAKKALDDFDWAKETKELENQIKKLNENAENLLKQYEDTEFWANREYEQSINSIEQTYGDIDKLVIDWLKKYGKDETTLTNAYQSLTNANSNLVTTLVGLDIAISALYETVGNNGIIIPTNGVKSFDTGGEIVGSGLILAHDKERVLTQEQNAGWTRLINNIESANKLVDIAKLNIQGYRSNGLSSVNKDSQTVIHSVTCNFPSITTTDGLQRAILELPRLALHKK
jgi:hypothetical protein